MYYKSGQACVTNWGSFIFGNQGKCCYKLGQLSQIRSTIITKQDSYYKLGQNLLQIGAGITNQGNYYKLEHNKWCDLLLLDTKENANLQRVDVAFSTLINYLRKLFEIFKGYFQTCTSQNTTGKCLQEKADPKF